MRLYTMIIMVIFFSLGCAKGTENAADELSLSTIYGKDTLIFSNPKNYTLTMDKSEAVSRVEIRSYKDMLELFEKHRYTPAAWQSGIREVPRIYLPLIGDRWGTVSSKEVTTENKKRLFFRGLAPLILRSNELIMADRKKLEKLRNASGKDSFSEDDKKWISKLAQLYKVDLKEDQISPAVLDELWIKVDIVPVSLALAQAAEESGWGTSRFADKGNAVYGQWTWGSDAIKPEQQRKELGNYGIASFETLQQSVSSYMLNLNTHNAYASLRAKRAELRKKNEPVTGFVLAGELTKYSEKGEAYVKGLRSLMEYNLLIPADEAYLSKDPAIYLVPVAD